MTELVAARFVAEGLEPVLDVGCGDGELLRALPRGHRWIGLDADGWQRMDVLADAVALPVRDGSVPAVAALWMLYHLEDARPAIAEAHRVLRPGGLFAAVTSFLDDSPELLEHLPPVPPSSFDGDDAAALVGEVFADVELVDRRFPYVHLPDRDAVAAHLCERGIDFVTALEVADRIDVPVDVTRHAALVWGRR